MSDTPTIAQALRSAIEARLVDVHTSMPGAVVAYNPVTRRASVQPLLKRGVQVDGERVVETLPVVNEVPILFFGGMGASRLRLDLRKGDTVLLVFAEGSLDRWINKGGLVDPEDDRRHALTDAFALPFSTEGGGPEIFFTETEIHAGGTEALATKADLQAVVDKLNSHVHTGVTSGGQVSGLAQAVPAGPPVSFFPTPGGTAILKGA